jgi:hypothetical protein
MKTRVGAQQTDDDGNGEARHCDDMEGKTEPVWT